jgi:hypothetical protein
MQPKNVAFVGAICITIGWLLASTVAPPVARVQSRPQERGARGAVVPDPPAPQQVQLRSRPIAPTPEGRRNPFVFGAEERVPTTARAVDESQPSLQLAAPAPAPSGPPYSLSGIGTTGDTRTAVLTTGADVHIVRVNDAIGGYVVTDVSVNSVTLSRGSEHVTLRLAH